MTQLISLFFTLVSWLAVLFTVVIAYKVGRIFQRWYILAMAIIFYGLARVMILNGDFNPIFIGCVFGVSLGFFASHFQRYYIEDWKDAWKEFTAFMKS